MKNIFRKNLPHILTLFIMLSTSVIYFYPQLQGKSSSSSDMTQFRGASNEDYKFTRETGETTLWTGAIFSGMPAYQLSVPQKNNLLQYVKKAMYLGFERPIGLYFFGMLSFYILMIALGVNPWLSMIGSILFAFTTGNISLYEAGHMTKLGTIFSSPPIIAGMILIFNNKFKIGGLLFTLFLGFNVMFNHPQMTYYLAMAMGIYFILVVITRVKEKKMLNLGKQILILLVGSMLALGASSSRLLPTYEYSKSTMRGAPIITSQANNPSSSSNVEGLNWDYAMNWSNGYRDLLPTFIPLAVGGSSSELLDKDTPLIRQLPNYSNQPFPLYWGELTFTAGPFYFGALMFFLFLFGAFVLKGPLKWWLVSAVLLTFLLSLGKNFEFLNRFLFDYFPMFNKFRTPNSVLSVTSIFIPVLAILGLKEVIESKKKDSMLKPLYISAGSLIGIALIMIMFGESLFLFESNYDSSLGQFVDALKNTRIDYLKSSSTKSILFILTGAGLIFFFIKNKLKPVVLFVSIGIIAILDLWVIDKRYLSADDFVSKRNIENEFVERSVDKQILADPDPHYRVLDIPNFGSSASSYYHRTIGGYHAAKLQRYQDLIDYHISQNNQSVINMLNTKYIIFNDQEGNVQVQLNQGASGNSWFISNIMKVNSAKEEITALNEIDPKITAIMHSEFEGYISNFNFTTDGNINLTSYTPNKVSYQSNSANDQFAVFSEIWYQPGWNAYIDGNLTEHIRVNYVLRGMKIPEGNHNIEFKFEPKSFLIGEKISFVFSLMILLGVIGVIAQSIRLMLKD